MNGDGSLLLLERNERGGVRKGRIGKKEKEKEDGEEERKRERGREKGKGALHITTHSHYFTLLRTTSHYHTQPYHILP